MPEQLKQEITQEESQHLVDGKYSIYDLVNIDDLRRTFELFSRATGFTVGFVSFPEQEILIATGWRDICTKFHRANPESAQHCLSSNVYLTSRLKQLKELSIKHCENGLVDGATPVIIRGRHLASLATGQVLFEQPDRERFRRQAEKYGYDAEAYLKALDQVPVVTEAHFRDMLTFLVDLAISIAEIGLYNLQLTEKARELGREITERQRAEAALAESEKKYRLLVETADDAIFIAQDGVIKFPNPRTFEMVGYSREELINTPFLEFVHPDYRKLVAERHMRRLAGEVIPSPYAFKVLAKDQSELWVQINAVTTQWEGRPATLNFLRDITAEKRMEQRLRQAQKMEALGTLAGGIAHDFNNILAGIMGYAELALDEADKGKAAPDKLQRILTAANQAKGLIHQILTFSRKASLELKPVDISQEIANAIAIMERTIPKMIKVEKNLAQGLPWVNGDANQIQQVILNLAANAMDAMPDGGKLVIETESIYLDEQYADGAFDAPAGEYVLVSVSDTGEGIDKEDLEHIYEPFYTTKEMGKGTGLGLASVYGIVASHSGFINCYSEPGSGTIFRIYLPAMPASDREGRVEKAEAQTVSGGSETILLVDDEKTLLDVGREILCNAGYQVITARDGEEALAVFREQGPAIDLVILDIIMPGMGGHKCLEQMLLVRPETKIIVASGYSYSAQQLADLVSRAAGYIAKPFRIKEILSTVRQALDA